MAKYYSDSHVEVQGIMARKYSGDTGRLFARLGREGDLPRMETNKLVSEGYYACMRHPMHFGLFLFPLALASNFMDVDTIIPSMLIKSGGNSIHLGILTAIMLGGSSLFQLIFAGFLSNHSYKRKYLLGGINLRVVALFSLSVLFFKSPGLSGDLLRRIGLPVDEKK